MVDKVRFDMSTNEYGSAAGGDCLAKAVDVMEVEGSRPGDIVYVHSEGEGAVEMIRRLLTLEEGWTVQLSMSNDTFPLSFRKLWEHQVLIS